MPAKAKNPKQIAFNFEPSSATALQAFAITVKRSPRRSTIEIIIRDGGVSLMLPTFVSKAEGMAFVRKKQRWISSTLEKQIQVEKEKRRKIYLEGESFELLGKSYKLRVFITPNPTTTLVNGELYVGIRRSYRGTKQEAVKQQVWSWYEEQALKILSQKTYAMAEKIGKKVAAVKMRRTKTKWGHCTREGVIQYNWQIITAPEAVVDYLVAHEVSHLVHLNHGPRFWRHVAKLCPDYLQHEQWLKHLGHTIEL